MSAAAAFKAREAEVGTAPSDIELPSYTVSDAGTSQAGELASPDRPVSALSAPSPTPSEAGLDADEDGPPPYSPSTAFVPTMQLQIETSGKQWLSLPSPPRPDPIPVYPVDAGGATDSSNPIYLSLRPKRSSGSCTLVRFDEPNGTALSSTSYFFGPGRYAQIKLGGVPVIADSKDKQKDKKNKKKADASPVNSPSASTAELATESNHIELPAEVPMASTSTSAVTNPTSVPDWASFEIKPVGTFTRAVRFTTPLGLFEWRYAGRKERKELGMDSLLVMDHIVRVFRVQDRHPPSPSQNPAQMGSSFRRFGRGNNNNNSPTTAAASSGGGIEQDEQRTPVARFLRNDELRSPGSGSATAGNGGRLVLDLSKWGENSKTDREAVEILAVTTCISMLKKEVDRRRHQQIAIMVAAAS